ncbi:MAG: CPBP family intramembrane metalloprotease [Kofleriaceae bacterium]|nr:MAG: CPBP family intramembrane metalloprotease [Kofleriaceae bacterium]
MHDRSGMWSRVERFVRRHPVASYVALTFAISWGGLLVLVGPGHIVGTREEFERLVPIGIPVVALGPMLASLLLTAYLDGRRGLRTLGARLARWRVEGRWYAVALLLAPAYFLVVSLALSLWSRDFLPGIVTAPDRTSHLLFGLAGALVAGLVEELGWTGFATPRLRRRFGPEVTGLVVGSVWGLWHVLPKVWGAAAHGVLAYLPQDLACAIVGLTGFRILMVWVHDRTRSLLLAVLMHVGLTAATLVLTPLVTGGPLMTTSYVLAAVPWLFVAAVWMARHEGGAARAMHAS